MVLSPVLLLLSAIRYVSFAAGARRSSELNRQRIERARTLKLPALEWLEITVLVDWRHKEGFVGDAAVSYLLHSDRGSLLVDVGFGPQRPSLAHNASRLDFSLEDVEALAITHLHLDHMGGIKAQRRRQVMTPSELGPPAGQPCFLPEEARAPGFDVRVVDEPQLLHAGIASTGPLARSMFFLGWTEEQVLVAAVKGKSLVVLTGCGHPTLPTILDMVAKLSDKPVHAVVGGLHLPLRSGRGSFGGVQAQMLVGTGKPPWERLDERDFEAAATALDRAGVDRLLLSAHDSCDYAIDRLGRELDVDLQVLEAGAAYRISSTPARE